MDELDGPTTCEPLGEGEGSVTLDDDDVDAGGKMKVELGVEQLRTVPDPCRERELHAGERVPKRATAASRMNEGATGTEYSGIA